MAPNISTNPARDINAMLVARGGQPIKGLENIDAKQLAPIAEKLKLADEFQAGGGNPAFAGMVQHQQAHALLDLARLTSANGGGMMKGMCGGGGVSSNPVTPTSTSGNVGDLSGASNTTSTTAPPGFDPCSQNAVPPTCGSPSSCSQDPGFMAMAGLGGAAQAFEGLVSKFMSGVKDGKDGGGTAAAGAGGEKKKGGGFLGGLGKLAGGIIGSIFGGPIGGMIGSSLGSMLDGGAKKEDGADGASGGSGGGGFLSGLFGGGGGGGGFLGSILGGGGGGGGGGFLGSILGGGGGGGGIFSSLAGMAGSMFGG
jgi:hypothetical protein